MARLSTGQTFGDVSRVTAARLLGGIPTDGFAGALAQGSITTPSLAPKAAPVETFQGVGAPTLGGAPKFFAPPDLPNPGSDLANLARSLGGFSTTLQSFGETLLANQQNVDKQRETEAAALVGQTSRYGPARSIADLAANLEKTVALGGPGAVDASRMLQVVREKQNSSVGKYWLERSIENYSVQSAALGLPDKLANTSTIKVGGKDVELNSLPSDDPRYREYRDQQLFGGQAMSTSGYTKNQGIILQAQLQADEAQRKRYNTAQGAKVAGQISVDQRASAQQYVSIYKTGAAEAATASAITSLQSGLDKIKLLPLSQEQQTDQINKYAERWASEVVVSVKQAGGSISDMRALLEPLRYVMTGPVEERRKKDGTRNDALLLYNTLGGEAYFDQVVSKANASQIQDNTQRAQMAGIAEQQAYDTRLQTALPEGRRSNPGAIKSFFQSERERAAMEPDGILRAAKYSQLDASERQLTETYVKPVQEQRALWYAQQLGRTVNDEAARNRVSAQLQADLAADLVTSATATSIQTTLSAQGSKEVKSYDKDINKRIDTLTKEWEAYSGSPNSYGGSTVAGYESTALYKARDEARRKSQDTVYQAIKEGKDPMEALNKLWTNSNFGLRRREEVGGTQAPMYTNGTQLIQKNTGNWSRSSIDSRSANQLRGQAKIKPLYNADAFATDVDAFLNGAPSQNFRTLMKTLTTGPGGQKASEVILNQFRLQGIDVPEDQRQRIQSLDGQRISVVPTRRRQSPQQNQALAGIQIVGRALGTALIPPASAQTAPPPVPSMAMFYASPTAPPKPPATKPAATPQARVDGYMKRLSYIETRLRNIPNAEGSPGRGYFQAFPPFAAEAISASGGIDPRDPDFNKSAKATAAWIRTYNKRAWTAIRAGRYDEADRLLRNTWPSLPGGSQAQEDKVQRVARRYLR
jgi:hypothetical protein